MFEIGNSLREARVRRGVDFAQAELATKIRGKYLRALEDEQFALLPAQTYVKGFLRTYAEYLGLDGQLYVDEFNSRFVTGSDEHEPRARRSAAARPQRRNRRSETNLILLALAAIAVLTVIVVAAWKASSDGGAHKTKTTASRPAVAHRRTAPPKLLVIRPKRGSTHVIIHKSNATGDILFDGTVTKGDPARAFTGTRLWVSIDTPENLRVIINGHTRVIPGHMPRVGLVTKRGWRTL
ncbi:MAG TPA: helix-turn-helix transcriptional regulator [Gaiellaceae bacterium]